MHAPAAWHRGGSPRPLDDSGQNKGREIVVSSRRTGCPSARRARRTGPSAKVDCLAEKDPVTVREDHLADVELVAVAVSDPQKVRYGGLAEKEAASTRARMRVGRLRRTTEAAS